jgi:hypothetical protein
MFVASYRHNQIVSMGRDVLGRLLAITIALSFFAMWVPIAGAAWGKSGVMACCIGKEAGHCDSGFMAAEPPPPPEPEPVCGSHSATSDSITIVAEPYTDSHTSSRNAEIQDNAESEATVESASLSRPCPMDCGACTASTSRVQKRQKDIIQAKTFHSSAPGAITRFEDLSRVSSANESWTNINPRGPPATSLRNL